MRIVLITEEVNAWNCVLKKGELMKKFFVSLNITEIEAESVLEAADEITQNLGNYIELEEIGDVEVEVTDDYDYSKDEEEDNV